MSDDPQSADDFSNVDDEWVPTTDQICQKLIDYVLCPAGSEYVGTDAVEGSDHGHTACLFVGWAIKRLRETGPM